MKVLLMIILVVVVLGNRHLHKKKGKSPAWIDNPLYVKPGERDHLPQYSGWKYKKPDDLHLPQKWHNNPIYKKPGKREWINNAAYNHPGSFDARTSFTNCPIIKDITAHGNTKSSWALAVTAMMNDRICIMSEGTDNFKYSYHHLLSCCMECGSLTDGGDTEEALKYFQSKGVVSEECQYFRTLIIYQRHFDKKENPKCYKECTDAMNLDYENDKRRALGFRRIITNKVIMFEIKNNGPVVADMEFYTNFRANNTNKVYKKKVGTMTLRSVRLLGWGVFHDGPYWLVASSEGVIKILRGSNFCGIESKVYAGYPNVTISG